MEESTSRRPVRLDGRHLEGGGQLLRTAISLSALTGIPVEIFDIRGNRGGGGGLKAQHLACVKWLATACNARVTGAERKSKQLLFEPHAEFHQLSLAYTPRRLEGEDAYDSEIEIGTAGSTGLVLQAVLPYILFAPPTPTDRKHVFLRVIGGTNVSGSPSYEYITQVLLPMLEMIGLPKITSRLENRGWSQGGTIRGSFVLRIPIRKGGCLEAFKLSPLARTTKPAKPKKLQVTLLAPATIAEHFKMVLIPALQHYFGDGYTDTAGNVSIKCIESGQEKRLYLIAVAIVPFGLDKSHAEYRLARDWLYDRKVRSTERAVTEMCERVVSELYQEWRSGAWVDEHMRDQLVIFQALARGKSSLWHGESRQGEPREPSLHARTAEWVAHKMTGASFAADNTCEGVGLEIRSLVDIDLSSRLANASITR